LKLRCDKLRSNFAFNVRLCHYTEVMADAINLAEEEEERRKDSRGK